MQILLSITEVFKSNFTFYKDYFVQQIQNPAWDNPFYIIPAICILTFLLELFLPRKLDYKPLSRKGFTLDLFYVVFFDYLILLFGFYALASSAEYLFKEFLGLFGVSEFILFDIKTFPFLFQFLIVFILLDFLQWFGHYLLHRFDFLWQFHKIHHAQEELGFASTRHFHWVEYFVFKPLLFLPFMFMNFSVGEFVVLYLWIGYGFTFFSHCNIRVSWNWLNYILITPETHYWHHAKTLPNRYGVNFASTTTLWDHVFGFFYLPKDKGQPELGVDDQEVIPKTFFGQMIHPFKVVFSKSKRNKPLTRAEKRRLRKKK